MPRLILLNGPPGIGKSTLARRYVAEHPDTLCCDIDGLRSLIGGWKEDFGRAGALIRPAALALIGAYLLGGHDVVLPQMLLRESELERFEGAAAEAGAGFAHVVLIDEPDAVVSRFHARGDGSSDPWHTQVRAIVGDLGGDEELRRCCTALEILLGRRPDAVRVGSAAGDVDGTYRSVLAAIRT